MWHDIQIEMHLHGHDLDTACDALAASRHYGRSGPTSIRQRYKEAWKLRAKAHWRARMAEVQDGFQELPALEGVKAAVSGLL